MFYLRFGLWNKEKIIKHNLFDEHLNSARKEMEDETIGLRPCSSMERVYDSEEEYYFPRPKTKTKDNTKGIIKTRPINKPKTKTEESIYSGIKYECRECHAEFRKK